MSKILRVSHYPQIPCKPFHVEVKDLEEARKVMNMLANYDLFQFEQRIKPDFSNMTVLQEFSTEYVEEVEDVIDGKEGEWIDWSDDETGISDLYEYFRELERASDE